VCQPVSSNYRKGAKVSKVIKVLQVLGNQCQRKEETPVTEGPGLGCGMSCMDADRWTEGQMGCSWARWSTAAVRVAQPGPHGGHWKKLDFPRAEVWLM